LERCIVEHDRSVMHAPFGAPAFGIVQVALHPILPWGALEPRSRRVASRDLIASCVDAFSIRPEKASIAPFGAAISKNALAQIALPTHFVLWSQKGW